MASRVELEEVASRVLELEEAASRVLELEEGRSGGFAVSQ